VVHLDASVICDAPRLSPYRDEMRSKLAGVVGLQPLEVNVKFTTNEGLGFIGREEGMAALAIATLERAG
jgi:2-C-methyl-D-erythritol 2,4-cyclodiphosphate synthase